MMLSFTRSGQGSLVETSLRKGGTNDLSNYFGGLKAAER